MFCKHRAVFHSCPNRRSHHLFIFFSNTPINVSVFSATHILVHQCAKNKAMLLLTITNTGAGSKVVTEAL